MSAYRVVHSLPGRVRLRLSGWSGAAPRSVERVVCEIDGVRRAHASAHTRNLLVHFDARKLDERTLLKRLESKVLEPRAAKGPASPSPVGREGTKPDQAEFSGAGSKAVRAPELGQAAGGVVRELGRFRRRVRIPVPGLDRNHALAQRAVERMSRLPGLVRVTVSHLTGRILVEYSERQIDIEDVLAEFTKLELPDVPGEDLPEHPLDPTPLIESTTRTVGAGLGLTLLGLRRALGGAGPPPGAQRAAQLAGTAGIIEGLPPVTERLERAFGHRATQVAISGFSIVTLTFADSALGLAVSAAGAARLMLTVRARRERWKQYEHRTGEAEPANPGSRIVVAAGQRVPLAADVISGDGTALCRSGATVAVQPGTRLDAGALMLDGLATVRLACEPEFWPQPRQSPPIPTLYDRYLHTVPPVSLAYAALVSIVGRSWARLSATLLLVNPRAALIGAANANNAAAGRALRAGLIVVGSRERRPIAKPHALVIESARVLMDTSQAGRRIRAAPGFPALLNSCRRHDVRIELAAEHTPEIAAIARGHGLAVTEADALERIRQLQAEGAVVAVLSDGAHAAHEFAESDLAIGLTDPGEGPFAGRADLLAPNLESVAALIEIGARRNAAVSDSVLASALGNVAGATWGLAADPGFARASQATYVAALTAIADVYVRLRGGGLRLTVRDRLGDPRPERFGARPPEEVVAIFESSPEGLTYDQAAARRRGDSEPEATHPLRRAVLDQLRSPLTAFLAGGAALSMLLGAAGDVAMILAVIGVNTAVGAWQERQVESAADELRRLGTPTATALRGGEAVRLKAAELVPGDMVQVAGGDRVPADARLLEAQGLQVDEAGLTGESLPVAKAVEGETAQSRILLEGTEVVAGRGRAIVVAVGRQTRMGTIAAAVGWRRPPRARLGSG